MKMWMSRSKGDARVAIIRFSRPRGRDSFELKLIPDDFNDLTGLNVPRKGSCRLVDVELIINAT